MPICLQHPSAILSSSITLPTSKSISNRVLIIHQILNQQFTISGLSTAADTQILKQVFEQNNNSIEVGHAGTTMRFLTAYFAATEGKNVVLSGSERMHQRPIKILVEALKSLGADIQYLNNEGFPPLQIKGKKLNGGAINLDGSVSSQYISALLLIAPLLKTELTITFTTSPVSKPYILMTISMMRYFGVEVTWLSENQLVVKQGNYVAKDFSVEADWSAASYWYSMVALSKNATIVLKGLDKTSLQGDNAVVALYTEMGVNTRFIDGGIELSKSKIPISWKVKTVDFTLFPDLAQTYAVTCAALNLPVRITGLSTLRIKETDRIAALQQELNALGYQVTIEGHDLIIHQQKEINIQQHSIFTYNDHRMAMAFAPLALITNKLTIENHEVVEKSYPHFWKDLKHVGFVIKNHQEESSSR
ncbi:MAG: 3-phosphoshikimate 1-carboxyvinyltransferase [Flavobacteriales bacterium]|nr:3-phosphoshikimate 1-carboxyvinyltransferase [Flavobacteriales bacterium]|tara:strand:+ start:15577 stop:16833 length:1257 start_codon:yes stop_codon:yes gene_type:complete